MASILALSASAAAEAPLLVAVDPVSPAAEQALTIVEQQLAEGGQAIERTPVEGKEYLGILSIHETEGRLTLELREPRRDVVWSRTVDPVREGERAEEELALFARWAVQSLCDLVRPRTSEPKSVLPIEPPAQTDSTSPPARDPFPSRRAYIGAGYVGTSRTDQIPWEHGVSLSVLGRLGRRGVISVAYGFFPDVAIEGQRASGVLSRHPARVSVGSVWDYGRWQFGSDASVVFDYGVRTTAFADALSGLEETATSRRVEVGGGPGVSVRHRFLSRMTMFVSAGVDVMFARSRFVDDRSASTALLEGRVFQPRISAGLEVLP